jgi:hypothetical protein
MTDNLSTVTTAFAQAILTQQYRPLRLRWSQRETHFSQQLLVQRVELREALLEGLEGQLTCLSIDPDLPLQELLGQPIGVEMVTDRGGLHHINGLITDARAGHADGALRVYQLTLRDALWVMRERINTRIFRGKNVPAILEIMLREWRQRSPVLASAFSFDLDRLDDARYPIREISHQFNESDAHFIERLCRREGITWYIATPQASDGIDTSTTPAHTLVFCDQVALLPQDSAANVRYHRDGATEERDSISAWSCERSLTPASVQRASWDYKSVRIHDVIGRSLLMRAGKMFVAFAAKHMKLISGKGSIKVQAHEEHIDLSAARRILLEASEEIILQAPKISIRSRENTEITGGGSFSRWNASQIEHGTSGQWRQQAAEHNILGPANCPPPDIPPPLTYEQLQQSASLLVRLRSHARDGRLLAHQPYTLLKQGAQIAVGVTDAAGQLLIEDHQPGDKGYSIKLPNGYCFDLPVHEQLNALDEQLAASGYRSAETDAESRLRHAGA